MRFEVEVLSFHLRSRTVGASTESVWYARRRSASHDRVESAYASSQDCLAITYLLNLAEQIGGPTIDLPQVPLGGLYQPAEKDGLLDDAEYTLHATGAFPPSNARARVVISGDSMSPIGALAIVAKDALASCWRDAAPAL